MNIEKEPIVCLKDIANERAWSDSESNRSEQLCLWFKRNIKLFMISARNQPAEKKSSTIKKQNISTGKYFLFRKFEFLPIFFQIQL